MKLGSDRHRDRVGFRYIVEVARAIHRDAIVEVLEGLVDSQLLPERADLAGIVHDVAHAKDESGGGAPRFQCVETVAKLSAGAQRLVIHQNEVRGQPLRSVAQDLTAQLSELS